MRNRALTALARALLSELGPDDLRDLAELLRPYLEADDPWLDVKAAAAQAGCTIPALRHAMRRGQVDFTQHVAGGKVTFRRSALDRWPSAGNY
jgi:hypothetical protein